MPKIPSVPRRHGFFLKLSKATSAATGQPWAFGLALTTILVWGTTGPIFHFSDTWQLVINTTTTIVTFLMVFLIQNTQNRDSQALHLKIDELIRALKGAHTAMIDLEEMTDHELLEIRRAYLALAEQGREKLRQGDKDTGTPAVRAVFGKKPD
jgi:low affinity Fe/Cu permease